MYARLKVILFSFALFSVGCSLNRDFAALVRIRPQRELYLQCKGEGSPTVVLISGFRGAHDDWTSVIDATGKLATSDASVFSQVARFSRVCAYDRPGTTLLNGSLSPSTAVSQPSTAQQGAEDLHALLVAAGERAPYVLAAHSWGGLNAYLFTSRFVDDVVGLVLVDSGSEFLQTVLTTEEWSNFVDGAKQIGVPSELEAADYANSVAAIHVAEPLGTIPSVVLTADKPFDFGAGPGTWEAWLRAQDLLSEHLNATHVTQTNSGHAIQIEEPKLVVDAIRQVLEASRNVHEQRDAISSKPAYPRN